MEIFSFRTIAQAAEGFYKESGSRFLSFAYPVSGDEDIRQKLEGLRKKYYDATHHCYAWMLGPGKERFRANDDGEPNHSAGDPILGQLRARDVTDVLVVVVRYFGGTKLGVGGLIHAYKTATELALSNAVVLTKEVTRSLRIAYAYEDTPVVMKLVKEFDLKILHQEFEGEGIMEAAVRLRYLAEVQQRAELLIALRHKISLTLTV